MHTVPVAFRTGMEVLEASWAYQSARGVVVRRLENAAVGDEVVLDVSLEESGWHLALKGHVVTPPPRWVAHANETFIEFLDWEQHSLLIEAAWADIRLVPARRSSRHTVDAEVLYELPGRSTEGRARLVEMSRGGLHLRSLDARPGDRVVLRHRDHQATGVVRWAKDADAGVEFDGGSEAAIAAFIAGIEKVGITTS